MARSGIGVDYTDAVHIPTMETALALCPTGEAWHGARTAASGDSAGGADREPWQIESDRRGFRSCAAFPIKVRGEARAVLSLHADSVDYFDAEQLQLLERLAMQVGVALEVIEADAARTRAETELRARLRELANERRRFGYRRPFIMLRPKMYPDGNQRVEAFDTVMRRADGSEVDVAFAAVPFEVGVDRFMLASYVDISLRRQVEKSLEEQADQLERMVSQRTADAAA